MGVWETFRAANKFTKQIEKKKKKHYKGTKISTIGVIFGGKDYDDQAERERERERETAVRTQNNNLPGCI